MVMFIPLLASDVRLIDFDRSVKQFGVLCPRGPNTVGEVPSIALRDVKITVQFHTGHALEVRRHEVQRDHPLTEREPRRLHHRICSHREVTPTASSAASVRHRVVIRDRFRVLGPAVRTKATFGAPPDLFKPGSGRGFVGEHLIKQLYEGYASAGSVPWSRMSAGQSTLFQLGMHMLSRCTFSQHILYYIASHRENYLHLAIKLSL